MTLQMRVLAGRLATVQDLGRTRSRDGLCTGGALDQHAAAAANALVGNAPGAPAAEMLLAGMTVVFSRDALVAVTGAQADVDAGGLPVPQWQPVVIPAGVALHVGPARGGNLLYLAVAGTWDVPRFAGGVGPDAGMGFATDLAPGRVVTVGGAPARLTNPWLDVPLLRPPAPLPGLAADVLDVMPGPDLDAVAGLREALTDTVFTVSPRSDHVGVRLDGALPSARPRGEVLSHGVAIGAVELPPSGELIVLQRGRSLTAGYPVVAVVSRATQGVLAQLRPGAGCRLRWRSGTDCVADARRMREAREATARAVHRALAGIAAPRPAA